MDNSNLDNIKKTFGIGSEEEFNEALSWLTHVSTYMKIPENVDKLLKGLKTHFKESSQSGKPVQYESKDYILKNLREISYKILKESDYGKLDLDSLSTQKLTEITIGYLNGQNRNDAGFENSKFYSILNYLNDPVFQLDL